MGFLKKIFGGKSESEKAKEELSERTKKLEEYHRQVILEMIATQEKLKNASADSSTQSGMVKIILDKERSWMPIWLEMEDNDQELFYDLEMNAVLAGKEFFYFPKKKWDKAIANWESEKEFEQVRNTIGEFIRKGYELEKSGDIEKAISAYEECLKFDYPALYPYKRLSLLYHKIGDIEKEKGILTKALELYPDNTRYKKKLAILNGTFEEKVITSAPKEITITEIWGDVLEERIHKVPEFDFYYERETNPKKYEHESGEIPQILSPIFEIRDHFKTIEAEAETAEELGEQERAARLYEQMVAEKYYMPSPYDRLIKIYSKAKLKEEEKRILTLAIAHFKQLREKRKAYVLHLAQKYDAVDFANERINNGKKITYYDGAFELYNPFPIVERWEARLQKLLSKK